MESKLFYVRDLVCSIAWLPEQEGEGRRGKEWEGERRKERERKEREGIKSGYGSETVKIYHMFK